MSEEIKVSASDRSLIKIIDDANYSGYGNAVTAEIERLHIRISTLQAEVDFLRLESENMALSLESAGYGRPSGKMCTPLERYRSKYPRHALNSTKGEK